MQNVFQVDPALMGPAPGMGSVSQRGKGPATPPSDADPRISGHAVIKHERNQSGLGSDGLGGDHISEFHFVFDNLRQANAAKIPAEPGQPLETDMPIDALLVLETVFLALDDDQIDMGAILGPNPTLNQQAQTLLSGLTERLGAMQPGDLRAQDMIGMLKDVMAAFPQTLGTMAAQLTALTAQSGQSGLTAQSGQSGLTGQNGLQIAAPSGVPPIPNPATGRNGGNLVSSISGQLSDKTTTPLAEGGAELTMLSPNGRLNGTTPFASDATTSTTTPAAQLGKPPMDARLTQGDATPQTQTPQQSQNPAQPQATTITPTGDDMPQPTPPLTRDLDQRRIVASGDLEDARRVAAQDRTNDLPRDVLPARTSPHLIAPTLPNAATPALLMDPAFAAQTGLNHDADAASLEAMSDTAAREARSTAPLGTIGTPSTVAPSQMTPAQAQQVTRQIAFAIQNNPGSKVEIMLNPAELGHVRISLSSAEAGMIVSIQADRPETLELMRRHADLLASDFRDIGYDSTSFSFEGSGGQKAASDEGDHQNRRDDRPDSAGRSVAIDQTNATPPPAALRVGDGAIDIRL